MTAIGNSPRHGLGGSTKPKETVRVFWIVALWVMIAAFVMYMVWLANIQTTGSIAPPWYLPMY